MSIVRKFHSSVAIREVLHLLAWCALLTGGAYSQVGQNLPGKAAGTIDKDKVADALSKASEDTPESIYFVEQLAQAKAAQAIPMLETKFTRTKDVFDKAHVASALVRLGDTNDVYWDFLAKQATTALESDAPDFMNFDPQAKTGTGPSPAFIAWAKAHKVPPNGPNGTAAEDAMYWFPGTMMLLGLTRDPRAIPLLRQGLLSPNHMIENAAATGLAEIHDKDSIPFIIEACRKAPPAAAALIAESLVYFDDAEAISAVDTYIPKDRAQILRKARAQGKKSPLT
jgi:hypothetical protein